MIKFFLKISFIFLLLNSLCAAKIINEVVTSGNKRISKETIIVFGNIEMNKKDYNELELNLILKELYKTNFFKEIKLDLTNNILNIYLVENPIIESLEINGIKKKHLKN